MGKGNRNRDSKRKKSDDSVNNDCENKAGRYTATPEDVNLSDILSQTNQVLYENNNNNNNDNSCVQNLTSVFDQESVSVTPTQSLLHNMATRDEERRPQPTNSDIISYLEVINGKISGLEKRLISLENLEKKVDKFDKEMKKMWGYIEDNSKKSNERIINLENKTESTDFSLGLVNDKMAQLEKEKDNLHEELVYLQSQSMRNNLVK